MSSTREDKKTRVEKMAEKFMAIGSQNTKSLAIICMTAYEEGKEAGRMEERKQWQKELEEEGKKVG